jgi:hypothetical protein
VSNVRGGKKKCTSGNDFGSCTAAGDGVTSTGSVDLEDGGGGGAVYAHQQLIFPTKISQTRGSGGRELETPSAELTDCTEIDFTIGAVAIKDHKQALR